MRRSSLLSGQNVALILATASFFGMHYSAKTESCNAIGYWKPDAVVFENEPFARIWLHRNDGINVVQTVDYFTQGAAGIHFAASNGTASFGVGQTATNVDVPLIDNGLLDGFKDFSLVLTNPSPGLQLSSPVWVRIEDDEVAGASVDPLFVPDTGPGDKLYDPLSGVESFFVNSWPDGRILVSQGGTSLARLHSNGQLDLGFTNTLSSQFASLGSAQLLSDGRILLAGYISKREHSASRLVRLLPDGALDTIFTISNFAGIAVGQPDGKILIVSTNANNAVILRRLNTDGSADTGFVEGTSSIDLPWTLPPLRSFAFQLDGKIVMAGTFDHVNGEERPGIVRLHPDGSVDMTFSPPPFNGSINYLLLRRNGKMIVRDGVDVARQLNADGSIDAGFRLENPPLPLLEQPDGRFVAAEMDILGFGTVREWNSDGTPGRTIARIRGRQGPCSYAGLTLASSGPGHILLAGNVTYVDGFSRRGLVRLLLASPERDFRVLTPAEFTRSSGIARIRVVRTGPTTNAASVSFTTTDDTAKANVDYIPQICTLDFAPQEVSKDVMVPLLARTGVDARLLFKLELSNPSAGYTNIAATPIVILPDLRIATDSLRPRGDGSVAITLRGTVPGKRYNLESSTDLKNWPWVAGIQATGSTVAFDGFGPKTSPQFYRARTD